MKKIKKLQLLSARVLEHAQLKNLIGGMNNSDDCSAPVDQCPTGRICSGSFIGTGVCGINSAGYCACIYNTTSSLSDR